MKRRVQPHLRIGEGDVTRVVIITGNPDRVPLIASFMRDAIEIARYRGLVTYKGYTPNGNAITISGTGMGTPSTHICIEELARLGAQVFIRVGSCGGVDPSIRVGDVVVPTACVRDERTSLNYAPIEYPAVASHFWYRLLYDEASKALTQSRVHTGICWTSDVYYADPHSDLLGLWTRARVKCIEMESSLLFVFATSHGLDAASILVCDGNLHTGQKGEQKTESEQSGEQHHLFVEAMRESIRATINAIDKGLNT